MRLLALDLTGLLAKKTKLKTLMAWASFASPSFMPIYYIFRRFYVFWKHFGFATIFSVVCLVIATAWGFNTGMGINGLFIAAILGVMELSLSFDNAVVNAGVLKNMTPLWQHRFLTWGIAIAVFGMRIIFPIIIVAAVAQLGIPEVVRLAFSDPQEYAKHLKEAHIAISAFGGSFLILVFLGYLMDPQKEIHWLAFIERPLARIGKLDTIQVVITMIILIAATNFLVPHEEERLVSMIAGVIGIIIYLLVDGLANLFDQGEENADGHVGEAATAMVARAGLASFLYLEALDASFSLDGVIGAFAITQDVVIIAVGLAIGAIFVRSMTVMLVEAGTLQQFAYLEHGAHYGIGALAIIMFLSMSFEIPELVTGLIGVGFIVVSIWSSISETRRNAISG
jgi:uncharacterized protein